MDPASGVAAAKAVVGAGEIAYKGWGWVAKWWYGTVAITHPHNASLFGGSYRARFSSFSLTYA
jgi:hypothetical protein